MLTISAYHLLGQLYESANSLVYRGRRVDTQQPVVLKMLKDFYPTPERTAWFKREYEITRNLTIPGVVDAYALFQDTERLVMVLEDFGGDSLDLLGIAGQLELCEFLKLAIAITDILSQIHAANIIHKDINPSNIVLNRTTGQVKIIDFGISTVLSRENPTLSNPNILEGTLAYISPEQTGRMNRAIDYRSDFYSLGATFYKLLTGILPFNSSDTLELVHSHIAKQPVPPHSVVGTCSLPSIVSDIVMKLMAKNAEDRYQSAYGLKADLEICLHQLETKGQIDVFALARQDICDRFQIPQKLYGRKREIEILLAAFTRVAGGEKENSSISTQSQVEMILVAGYSGVGKSALVRELHKPITTRRGNFIWGKFDQYQRNIPYYALSQAFDELCKQLLTETEAVLNQWREKILAALGNNGQVLIDVIPNLERVIGTQPPVVQVEASQAQNRFNLVFQNFLKAICQKSHPLVLFIDDLQWADRASLNLLKIIMSDATIQYLLIIGAYRDNEVNASHPLMMTLEEIEKEQRVLSSIHLDNLLVQDVNTLISEALKSPPTSTQPLTDLVYEKTQGNAFFTTQFLKSLYTEGLLTFEYPPQSPLRKGGSKGGWQWNVAQIQYKDITDNVVELMALKIGKLSASTQSVLQLAACIGNKFDLSILGSIYQHQPTKVLADLLSAWEEGLIVPLDNKYKLIETEDDFAASEVSFKFLHDRVQQAVYSLIPESEKKAIHLKIGQILLHNKNSVEREENIFDIVNHLNIGNEPINIQFNRDELAELNLIAAKKAKAATAYELALKYLALGLRLLTADSWQYKYELTLTLYVEIVEVAYLNTDFKQATKISHYVLKNASNLLDKVKVYQLQIQFYMAQSQMLKAIDIGFSTLEMLGISLSSEPNNGHQIIKLPRLTELEDLPEMTNPHQLAALRLLMTVFTPAYIAKAEIVPSIILNMVNLCVQHGHSALAAYAYALYGMLSCAVFENINTGYLSGQLALKLLDKFNARELKSKVYNLFNGFIRPWKEHIRETIAPLQEGLHSGLETGDIEFASHCAGIYCQQIFLTGERLEIVEQKQAQSLVLLLKLKQEFSIYFGSIWRQLTSNLLGQAEDKCCLIGNSFNELKMLQIFVETNNRSLLFVIYFTKTYLSYLFKDYDQAVAHASSAEKYVEAVAGMASIAEHNFYYSLALVAQYSQAKPNEQRQYLSKVSANQEKMQKWADHAPMNFLHKFYLVEAEKARVLGQVVEAMDLYEQAIKKARDNGYIQQEALAYELAANFYLARGMEEFAQLYMTKAHYGYVCWGAKAKVNDLEQRYPDFFAKTPSSSTKTTTTILSTDSKTSSQLDLNSILKASQTLSSEIVLNTLLEKMMKIVLENAGAEKGYLILKQEEQWLIQASGTVTSDDIEVLQSIPIETVSDRNNIPVVPLGIVNYVIRTQESLILNDALDSGNFTRDPYIVKHQTKSVLCMPLLNQSKLAGLLYLENNQTIGAFTPDRLEVLKLLTSQIFISIENAKLYTNLQAYSTELLKANRQLQAEIGDRKLAEEALRLSEERFRLAIDNIPDTFVIYDAKRRFQFVNAFGVNRGGFPLEAYIGHTDEEIHPAAVTNAYLPLLQKTVQTRTKQTGECNITLPGCSFTIVVTYVPILNEHGEIHQILGITHDITERKRAEEQLLHNAFHDALTGLPNRAFFMECLKDACDRAKQHEDYLFAVLFLDLDRFKVINDSLGHLLGDQFLIKIASRLKACIRSIDTAARLGGDEFTILLEKIENLSEAIEVVERIQQQLALPFDLDGQEVFTTASIGIALNSILTYDQPEDLLRNADTAMYRAKVLGRARYELFHPDMYTNAVDRLQLETDLRRAIERQEFRVYYQPIVSLSSGTISGFEALLRWQHPERGLLSPADFIPLAEETGLIVEIGYWVLFEACRQMQVWRMRYPTSFLEKISVNLCVKQFLQGNLIEQIAQILHSTGLDACSLMLEITESAILENGDEANTASQLREMGIELSIDDFGTGYSSLGRLYSFPINVLKIDRSFVSPMDANNRNFEIIEIIVTLADKLGMDVTAEGVETQEQLALLRKLNCEYGQGYFFSRPLDSSAAEALIMANPQW